MLDLLLFLIINVMGLCIIYYLFKWQIKDMICDNRFFTVMISMIFVIALQSMIALADFGSYIDSLLKSATEEMIKLISVLMLLHRPERRDFVRFGLGFGTAEAVLKCFHAFQSETIYQAITIVSLSLTSIVNHCAYALVFLCFKSVPVGMLMASLCHATHNVMVLSVSQAELADKGPFFAVYMLAVLVIACAYVNPALKREKAAAGERG